VHGNRPSDSPVNLTCILSLRDTLNTTHWSSSVCPCDNTSNIRLLSQPYCKCFWDHIKRIEIAVEVARFEAFYGNWHVRKWWQAPHASGMCSQLLVNFTYVYFVKINSVFCMYLMDSRLQTTRRCIIDCVCGRRWYIARQASMCRAAGSADARELSSVMKAIHKSSFRGSRRLWCATTQQWSFGKEYKCFRNTWSYLEYLN
jgi:hypothetical protein